jgi:hypothetical protein
MARLVLLLLLVIAGALVVALVKDRRSRREAAIDGLRWAFVHGTPRSSSRPATLTDVVHPGGVRFRAPASWEVAMVPGAREVPDAPPGTSGRRVLVEVKRLGPAASAVAALEGLAVEGERSVEALPNGNALMKTLEVVRGERAIACYAWRLALISPDGGVRLAVFRIPLTLEAADDVIAQSDLATMDREVREAMFADGPAAT